MIQFYKFLQHYANEEDGLATSTSPHDFQHDKYLNTATVDATEGTHHPWKQRSFIKHFVLKTAGPLYFAVKQKWSCFLIFLKTERQLYTLMHIVTLMKLSWAIQNKKLFLSTEILLYDNAWPHTAVLTVAIIAVHLQESNNELKNGIMNN